MLKFKGLTAKNFLSIGNVSQAMNLSQQDLILILGENLDMGGNDYRNGVGKAQPLTARIKTPYGWTTMGDISVGDVVSTPDGSTSTVNGVFPQGLKNTYKMTFSDGRSTECCEDHLWKVYSHSNIYKSEDLYTILSTRDIIQKTKNDSHYENKSTYYMYVPLIEGNNNQDIDLPIHPYLLGLLLGDGYLAKSGSIKFSTADVELVDAINCLLSSHNTFLEKTTYTKKYDYVFKCVKREKYLWLREALSKLNLLGKRSYEKFIPEIYMGASVDQKLDLLAGLIDTDGHVGKNGNISFSSTSERLANEVRELVRSVGGLAKISSRVTTYTYLGVKKQGRVSYKVSIRYKNPRRLVRVNRKLSRISENYQYSNLKLRITDIEYIGTKESKCISIDHPEKLYITDEYIVTHNTTIINALSYALYGKTLSKIKIGNIINKTNGKNMTVSVEFERNGVTYFVERSRKPDRLVFKINGNCVGDEEGDNEARGSNSLTQVEIEKAIGVNYLMFTHIVVLNTYVDPFLKMGGPLQREFIEELLGITKLSEKANMLNKVYIKQTKDLIRDEDTKIKTITDTNTRLSLSISSLRQKQEQWAKNKEDRLTSLASSIEWMKSIDIEAELSNHQLLATIREKENTLSMYMDAARRLESDISSIARRITKIEEQISKVDEKKCPQCTQSIPDHTHETILNGLAQEYLTLDAELKTKKEDLVSVQAQISAIGVIPEKPTTHYKTAQLAQEQKTKIITCENELKTLWESVDTYADQITSLESNIETPDTTLLTDLSVVLEHQEYLLKLLTNKDSFIRKKIISQNLAFLNTRLEHYLNKINLQYKVVFLPDLDVEITEHGRDFDFDNLSRGERTRLSLSLSMAFRDVYEHLNEKIDLLFIDELIDTGLDPSGVDSCLSVLKSMVRDHNKTVFLISHKDELLGRIDNVMTVVKDGGFTTFSQ